MTWDKRCDIVVFLKTGETAKLRHWTRSTYAIEGELVGYRGEAQALMVMYPWDSIERVEQETVFPERASKTA